jgi:hypothetical protein
LTGRRLSSLFKKEHTLALLPKLELADRAFPKCEKLMQGIVHFDTLTDSLPESLVYVPMGIRTCKGRPPYQISHLEWVRDVPWNLDGGVIRKLPMTPLRVPIPGLG